MIEYAESIAGQNLRDALEHSNLNILQWDELRPEQQAFVMAAHAKHCELLKNRNK